MTSHEDLDTIRQSALGMPVEHLCRVVDVILAQLRFSQGLLGNGYVIKLTDDAADDATKLESLAFILEHRQPYDVVKTLVGVALGREDVPLAYQPQLRCADAFLRQSEEALRKLYG